MKRKKYVMNAPTNAFRNREIISRSEICGCFYCLATFPPSDIEFWTDGGETAICPKCKKDTVIGDALKIPINVTILNEIKKYWYGDNQNPPTMP